jgi:redox-sensing transcriptional repressor
MKLHNSKNKLPNKIVTRLSLYYQILSKINSEYISSQTLASHLGTNSAQVRKDISLFGQFGIPGKGYQVKKLYQNIEKILGIDRSWNVIIVGCGNLGSALLKYTEFKTHRFNIIAGFDVDKNKIGKTIKNIKIYPMENLKHFAKNHHIDIAAITVPTEVAQEVIKKVVDCGIKGILNFSATQIKLPNSIILKFDLTIEFIRLACLLANSNFSNFKDRKK